MISSSASGLWCIVRVCAPVVLFSLRRYPRSKLSAARRGEREKIANKVRIPKPLFTPQSSCVLLDPGDFCFCAVQPREPYLIRRGTKCASAAGGLTWTWLRSLGVLSGPLRRRRPSKVNWDAPLPSIRRGSLPPRWHYKYNSPLFRVKCIGGKCTFAGLASPCISENGCNRPCQVSLLSIKTSPCSHRLG